MRRSGLTRTTYIHQGFRPLNTADLLGGQSHPARSRLRSVVAPGPHLSRSGIATQTLQEKGAECPFLPSCDRSCPNARTRARIARAIVTVGLGVMVIPVRQATSVPLGGT